MGFRVMSYRELWLKHMDTNLITSVTIVILFLSAAVDWWTTGRWWQDLTATPGSRWSSCVDVRWKGCVVGSGCKSWQWICREMHADLICLRCLDQVMLGIDQTTQLCPARRWTKMELGWFDFWSFLSMLRTGSTTIAHGLSWWRVMPVGWWCTVDDKEVQQWIGNGGWMDVDQLSISHGRTRSARMHGSCCCVELVIERIRDYRENWNSG